MAGKYDNTRGLVSKTMIGKLSETLGFKEGLSYKQLMTKAATMSQKVVKQAVKLAGWKGAAALAVVEAAGYGAYKLMEKSKDRPTTKSKTESYAEMVKKDKAKGKDKVLARRDKNKKPEPKPIPKGLRESIAKDKKIVKVTPKKKPVEKKKVVKEKKKNNSTQLYMKKDGKNTLVEFEGKK
jgi:hypothetical protein